MTTLANHQHCEGLPFATGYLVNALACQGACAPHSGRAYSEAVEMGMNVEYPRVTSLSNMRGSTPISIFLHVIPLQTNWALWSNDLPFPATPERQQTPRSACQRH